jgi:NADH dehydrogenase/NADH:ubiquinone oxidoreductase subunit G
MRLAPALGMPIAEIDPARCIARVGSNLRHEVPMLAHRVRKAATRGRTISFINPARFEYLFPVSAAFDESARADGSRIWPRCSRALDDTPPPAALAQHWCRREVNDAHRAMAASSRAGERRAIWLGALALCSANYSELRLLARALAAATGSSWANWPKAAMPRALRWQACCRIAPRRQSAYAASWLDRGADARAAAARLSAAGYRAVGRCTGAMRSRHWRQSRFVVASRLCRARK